MTYPTSVKANGNIYPLNSDFRVAIRCNEVLSDNTINDSEKCLAFIYLLYGDKGLDNEKDYHVSNHYINTTGVANEIDVFAHINGKAYKFLLLFS